MNIGYNLDNNGNIICIGIYDKGNFEYKVSDEPFGIDTAHLYKKDLETGGWIYLPDVTPVDTTITKVEYDWNNNKAYITIADLYRSGPHEFDCDSNWTTTDCQNAINSKFNKL